jgi:hypothetical protein
MCVRQTSKIYRYFYRKFFDIFKCRFLESKTNVSKKQVSRAAMRTRDLLVFHSFFSLAESQCCPTKALFIHVPWISLHPVFVSKGKPLCWSFLLPWKVCLFVGSNWATRVRINLDASLVKNNLLQKPRLRSQKCPSQGCQIFLSSTIHIHT